MKKAAKKRCRTKLNRRGKKDQSRPFLFESHCGSFSTMILDARFSTQTYSIRSIPRPNSPSLNTPYIAPSLHTLPTSTTTIHRLRITTSRTGTTNRRNPRLGLRPRLIRWCSGKSWWTEITIAVFVYIHTCRTGTTGWMGRHAAVVDVNLLRICERIRALSKKRLMSVGVDVWVKMKRRGGGGGGGGVVTEGTESVLGELRRYFKQKIVLLDNVDWAPLDVFLFFSFISFLGLLIR